MVVKLSSLLCLLALINVGFAAGQQQPGLHSEIQCEWHIFQRMQALEPSIQIQAEAGLTEVWNHNERQLKCAGVTLIRHTIEPKGLLLPSYTNAPQLIYVIQGKGIQGTLIPGCPEAYQSAGQSESEGFQPGGHRGRGEEGQGQGQRSFQDRHQKIRHFRAGDILAVPAGVSQWAYNDGNESLITVVLLDTINFSNQLDINPRRFYLAGNPEEEHGRQDGRREGSSKNNVFSGLDTEWLSDMFNVDRNLIEKLQGKNDERGNIIKVDGGLQFFSPPHMTESEQKGCGHSSCGESDSRHGGRGVNGFEETICTMRLRENLDDPERADIYTPRGGRVSTINSLNLPVLSWLDLSAERGVLYENGLMAPHYYMNAHSITYVTRGRARVQVVDDQGQDVFDDVVSEGQLLVEPQNFVILRQALEDGYEYISFKTSSNAFRNTLAGQSSVFRGLPAGVIANAYQISVEDAQKLKFNRDETTVFQGQKSSERLAVA